jgi:SynChlorMet cassette radical SAM/SPASM protein ScmF
MSSQLKTEQYRGRRQEQVPPLQQLYVYLTEGCNLACYHCWLAPSFDPDGTRHSNLSLENFETILQEAKPLGLQSVKLTGGEPLLHPHFLELLQMIRREDLGLVIETNGILCTPEIAAEIGKCPRRFVSVSLDGADAATHDAIRGRSGSFDLAQQAVQHLVAANTPPQLIMSLMRSNVDQIEAVVSMAETLGAASVKFNIIQPSGRGRHLRETEKESTLEELIVLGHYVDTQLVSRTRLPLHFSYPLAFQPLSRIARERTSSTCGILGILGVLADGHYALCGIGKLVPELVFGTIGNDRLQDIWNEHAVLRELRDGLPDRLTGICRHCLMKHQCFGSCIAQNYYRSHSLWSPFWFCEQAERDGKFPNSRLKTAQ